MLLDTIDIMSQLVLKGLVLTSNWLDRHRNLPKPIYKASLLRHIVNTAAKRKEECKRAHSAPGPVVAAPLQKWWIVVELEWTSNSSTPFQCKVYHLFNIIFPLSSLKYLFYIFLLYMLDLKIVMLVSFDFKKSYLEWHSNNKSMPIFSLSILI